MVNSCPAPERRVKRTPSSSKMKQLLEDEADQRASSSGGRLKIGRNPSSSKNAEHQDHRASSSGSLPPNQALRRTVSATDVLTRIPSCPERHEDEADQRASSPGGSLKIGEVIRRASAARSGGGAREMKQLLEDEADQRASSSGRSSKTNRPRARSISSGAAFYAAAVSRAHQHNLRLRQAQQTSGAVKPAANFVDNLMRTASW